MKLLLIKLQTSHEIEDALTYFSQEQVKALGVEARKRSDFEQAGWANDSTVVDFDDIENLPDDMEFIAYFDQERDPQELIEQYKDKLTELESYGLDTGKKEISYDYVQDKDWNKVWQKYYHVLNFSRHLAIVPEWEDYQPEFPDQKVITLDPGLAFGTGGHTTTQLVMMALERSMTKPAKVLDVGTGSGILAIAASKLGAESVLATDISDEAVTAANENIALNKLNNIKVIKANLLKNINGKFDLILANILAEILFDLIPELNDHLAPNGKIIFSGIDYLQAEKVKQSLAENGFSVKTTMQEGRWVCLLIERKPE
ncbi:50S ribosomal protein L11 methyltransferase [Lactobacillus mulieris]|jgi:ribosomal protein L11 methyltransferase|uniref:Ribosomal protein L11 methyltransferase n=1 Tax=Lactobacillus mulieris TaxID=2508708 RepID=A0AAP3GWK1_9LACO|nr:MULTISPECIES: 50S ribosomal protein L11 methyltransferase [Lactobacillus]EEU21458.1 ribosomal protein L11 methyltransferase [Lactobacillus jensenii 27-2-CHN]EEX24329.1 ribosomal protein L11 methyltransferase [Lactobacillus jensenii 115-3-CHN]KAA9244506.1 50S ribosomal protein L11 methyltransferase [Lactobacillus jensenii]KAA9370339.1 50S ribosomal protein L11 methyltransferase [Lactobacillus jensenii]KAA9371744.1 50S ribosomal protein L11 methyltransferase [Lactobacillus jensenii]